MTYRAPLADIAFALKHGAGFSEALAAGLHGELGEELVDAVLAEAGRFATEIIAPLNTIGDRHGTPKWIRTSCPSRAAKSSAALPPLIAIAIFRYESS